MPASSPTAGAPTIARRCSRPASRRSSSSSSTCIRSRPPRSGTGIDARRARRGDRHRRPDADPGGSEESRLRGGRHEPARYERSSPRSTSPAASRSGCARRSPSRRSGTPPRTTPGSPRSCRAGWTRPASTLPPEPGLPRSEDPFPPVLVAAAREGRDAALRREPAPAGGALPADRSPRAPSDGPFATGAPPLQGKALSLQQRARRLGRRVDRPAAARPGLRRRQAHEPVRRGRAADAPRGAGRRRSPATRTRRSAASSR